MQPFAHRGISMSLAGWLWADLLLGLFAIFLAANAVAPTIQAARPTGIDPTPIVFRVPVSGATLLSGNAALLEAEQRRIADAVRERLAAQAPGRRAAIVFAYGVHERAGDGDRIAELGLALLRDGAFRGSVLKAHHELVPGDLGSAIALEIYLGE